MHLVVDRRNPLPLIEQLAEQVRLAIESGELSPGDPLPTIQEAARATGVNSNTVAAAYRSLEADGYLQQRKRAGTRVADEPPRTARRATISLLASSWARKAKSAGVEAGELARALAAQALRESGDALRIGVLAQSQLEATTLAEKAGDVLGGNLRFEPVTPQEYRSVDFHLTVVHPRLAGRLAENAGPSEPIGLPHHLAYGPEFPAGAD